MLVLTRKTDQSITLSSRSEAFPKGGAATIEITVEEIQGGEVRLGIQAPQGVSVHRKEIWVQGRQKNEASAAGGEPLSGCAQ